MLKIVIDEGEKALNAKRHPIVSEVPQSEYLPAAKIGVLLASVLVLVGITGVCRVTQ